MKMKIISICCMLVLAMLFSLGSAFANASAKTQGLSVVSDTGENLRLCGVRSLYIALKILGEQKLHYEKLLEQFPTAKEDGITLAQIEDCLTRNKYSCKSLRVDKNVLLQMKIGALAFVLDTGIGYSHIYLLRKTTAKTLQLIDAPHDIQDVKIEDIGFQKLRCLFVAKCKAELPSIPFSIWEIMAFVFLALGASLILLFVFLRWQQVKQRRISLSVVKKIRCLLLFLGLPILCTCQKNKIAREEAPDKKEVLFCRSPKIDLGRMPVKNGIASKKCFYEIKNTSDEDFHVARIDTSCGCVTTQNIKVIPAGKSCLLEAKMTTLADSIRFHEYTIDMIPVNHKIKTLRLRVGGRSDFASYLSRSQINLGLCQENLPKEANLEIFLLDKNAHKEIVKEVSFLGSQLFRYEFTTQDPELRNADDGVSYYLHHAKMKITYAPDKSLANEKENRAIENRTSESRATMILSLTNAEKWEVPIIWQHFKN